MSRHSTKNADASSYRASGTIGEDPAIEPWFVILLSALIPLLAGLFAPASWRTPLHLVGGGLCLVGLILLIRHERAVRRNSPVTDG